MVQIDKIVRSRRRSIGLLVNANAELIIQAPLRLPLFMIKRFVDQKERWISTKQEFFRNRKAPEPRQFVDGESFLYLGEEYTLTLSEDVKSITIDDKKLIVPLNPGHIIEEQLIKWYKKEALIYLTACVEHYSASTQLTMKSIRISSAKTRWGSCGAAATLNFSWRLMMAPRRAIDYVVVHELMHIKQMNHSRWFWSEVARVIPDYKIDERWFKENGHTLRF